MRIGELAKKSGLSASRIRFYEAKKVLPKPARAKNGYREYSDATATTLRLIDDAQNLGFSLGGIRDALTLAAPRLPSRKAMLEALECQLFSIDQHIRNAKNRRRKIVKLLEEFRSPG